MLAFWFVQSSKGGKQKGYAAFTHQVAPARSSTVMGVGLCKTVSHSFAHASSSRAVAFFRAVDLYLQSLKNMINLVLYILQKDFLKQLNKHKNDTDFLVHYCKAHDISG